MNNPLSLQSVLDAQARIRGKINRTPVLTSGTLDLESGAKLFFKCENLQKTGAFKARGATNAVLSLSEEDARRGVVTHSSGNHAAALAWAAKLRGISAHIVMPSSSPAFKQAAVRRYGGIVTICEPTLEARERAAAQVIGMTGAVLIHPYNDIRVMAGQGTTAVEMLSEIPDLDIILCPVGGGGQLSGIAVAAKNTKPDIRVVGVEPAGADDAARSFRAGRIVDNVRPTTIADGLLTSLGALTFAEIQRHVDDIVTVSDGSIVSAMRHIWDVMKIIVEPSGAVAFAAVLERSIDVAGKRVGLVLSGGNLDLEHLPWMRS